MAGKNRFVKPESHRLDLSDGDWVEVKKRLGILDDKRIESALVRSAQSARGLVGANVNAKDVEIRLDTSEAYMTKLKTYILDWSFEDERGKRVPVTESAIEALDPETAQEIVEELNKFLDEEAKRRKEDPFTRRVSAQKP